MPHWVYLISFPGISYFLYKPVESFFHYCLHLCFNILFAMWRKVSFSKVQKNFASVSYIFTVSHYYVNEISCFYFLFISTQILFLTIYTLRCIFMSFIFVFIIKVFLIKLLLLFMFAFLCKTQMIFLLSRRFLAWVTEERNINYLWFCSFDVTVLCFFPKVWILLSFLNGFYCCLDLGKDHSFLWFCNII